MIKHNFDQTPKLLQTFDQLIRSTEIRSSDPLSQKITIFKLLKIISFSDSKVALLPQSSPLRHQQILIKKRENLRKKKIFVIL